MKLQSILTEATGDDPFEPVSMRETEARLEASERELMAINHLLEKLRNFFHQALYSKTLPPENKVYLVKVNTIPGVTEFDVRYNMMKDRKERDGTSRKRGWDLRVYVPISATNEQWRMKLFKICDQIVKFEDEYEDVKARVGRLRRRNDQKNGVTPNPFRSRRKGYR